MYFLSPSYLRLNIDRKELIFISLLLLASLTMMQVFYPFTCLIGFLCLAMSFVVFLKPLIGIYIFILLYPLASVTFTLSHPRAPAFVCFEEIFTLLLFFVMILRQLSDHHQQPIHNKDYRKYTYKWYIFLLTLFFIWSIFTLIKPLYFPFALFGWWRFISSFVIMTYLLIYMDSYKKFIGVLIFYCFVSFIYALSAVYATNYAFLKNYELFHILNSFVSIRVALYNDASGILLQNVGLLTGVGFAPKHEAALLLSSGIFFAVFLMKLYESLKIRLVMVVLILLFIIIIYQVFSRISIAGMLIVPVFLCLAIPSWRKSIVGVFVILIVLNLAGLFGSSLIRTAHMKNMESDIQKIEVVASKSKYKASSLPGRIDIWQRSIERIVESKGMGSGPDSLWNDLAFSLPHAHNFVLTIAADYGLPGVVLILIFLIILANSSYKSILGGGTVNNHLWLLQVLCVSTSLHALFVYCFDMPIGRKHLWFMLGLLMASINLADKEAIKISRR